MKNMFLTLMIMLIAGVGMADNLALNGTVSATSEAYGWVTGNIIDDNTGTGWHSDPAEATAALTLDLGATATLTSVEIANRTDCCSERINGTVVTVEDFNHNVIATSEPISGTPTLWQWDNDGAGFAMARYVIIAKTNNSDNPFNIMELRAFGDYTAATNIAPADGAVGILIDKDDTSELSPTLEWAANEIVDAGSITGYFLYLGTDEAAVGDAVVGDDTMIGNTYMTATTYQHPADLDKDTTYFWRVDTRLQDDPNTITGLVWDFTTELTLPQIVTQPSDQSELVGEDAVFTIEAVDPLGNDLTYQWFFDPNTLVEGDETALSGNGADTDTLTVPAVERSDAGNYFCEVSNPRTVVSSAAGLAVGELVAYWPFDGSATEVITGTECTVMGDPVYGDSIVGGTAIELDGDGDYVEVPPVAVAGMADDRFTISLWYSSTNLAGQNPFVFTANNEGTYVRLLSSHLPWSGGTIYFDAGDMAGYDRINANASDWSADGEWHHVVFTKDSNTGTMTIYVDGALWLQGTGKPKLLADPTDILIGSNIEPDGSLSAPFKGSIDDLQIYDIALDEYDVADMYFDVTGETQCFVRPAGDLDDDCTVTLADFAIMAADWLACNRIPTIACD